MQTPDNLEEIIKLAVRDFARSIHASSNIIADMTALIAATSYLPLSNLDYWESLIRYEFFLVMERHSPPKWKIWAKPSGMLTWIDLISRDGYKREKTLRTLSGPAPNRFFFALLLRRLNDWVPQVRQAAREKLLLIAQASDPTHIVDALYVTLLHFNSWGRMNESDKKILLSILCRKDVASVFKERILLAPSGPMTFIMSQIGRTPVLDADLSEIAKNAIQPSVRAKAYRSQFEGAMTWCEGRKWEWTDVRYCKGHFKPIISKRELTVVTPLLETLKSASIDLSPMVRRIAAEILIRELKNIGNEAWSMASIFASDRSASVAERGGFALKQLEGGLDTSL
jgi:hypothetical protein